MQAPADPAFLGNAVRTQILHLENATLTAREGLEVLERAGQFAREAGATETAVQDALAVAQILSALRLDHEVLVAPYSYSSGSEPSFWSI
jgi:dihydrodipicolinate synthase/N-acetylneuraminate lyase